MTPGALVRAAASYRAARKTLRGLVSGARPMFEGDWLAPADLAGSLSSPDNSNHLVFESGGWITLWRGGQRFAVGGAGNSQATRLILRPHGVLVVEDAHGRALWSTPTYSNFPTRLVMQDDGNAVIYAQGPSGLTPIWATNTSQDAGFFSGLWNVVSNAGSALLDLANVLHIPGVNLEAALLTGHDPIAAAKLDVSNFKQSAELAQLVAGNAQGIEDMGAQVVALFQKGIPNLPADAVPQILAAVQDNDPSQLYAMAVQWSGLDPAKLQAFVQSPGYQAAWTIATNAGQTFVGDLPAPSGMAYASGAPVYTPRVPASFTPALTAQQRAAQGFKSSVERPATAQPNPWHHPVLNAVATTAIAGGASALGWWAYKGFRWVTPTWARPLTRHARKLLA